jgi:LemA protein
VRSKAEGELSAALGKLIAVAENYPDLKANQNFLALQEELTSTENKIGFSRQYYNDSVLRYNNQTMMFPSSMIAGVAGFKADDFFEITAPAEREAPRVSFT